MVKHKTLFLQLKVNFFLFINIKINLSQILKPYYLDAIKFFFNKMQQSINCSLLTNIDDDETKNNDQNNKKIEIKINKKLQLLLQFVEYLEKLIFNACESTAISLNKPNKLTKSFFRTNKQTCYEWFWRIRYFLIVLCLRIGNYEQTVRHSNDYIIYAIEHQNINTTDFEQVIIYFAKALIKLGEWQELIGLYNLVNSLSIKKKI